MYYLHWLWHCQQIKTWSWVKPLLFFTALCVLPLYLSSIYLTCVYTNILYVPKKKIQSGRNSHSPVFSSIRKQLLTNIDPIVEFLFHNLLGITMSIFSKLGCVLSLPTRALGKHEQCRSVFLLSSSWWSSCPSPELYEMSLGGHERIERNETATENGFVHYGVTL